MKINSARFGQLNVEDSDIINFPEGILGFSEHKSFCILDAGDDTLILWLQSVSDANVSFPIVEPKIFKKDYVVKLSAQESKALDLENLKESAVFSILTIPKEVTQMTANLKAPIVINLKKKCAKQVILQESEFSLKHPMFIELKTQLLAAEAVGRAQDNAEAVRAMQASSIKLSSISVSGQVKSL